MDGLDNPCSSEKYGVGSPSLEITERLIQAHLSMLDEKECFSSELGMAWVFRGISRGHSVKKIPRKTHVILSSDEKHSFSSNMEKWAGINLLVIPSDGKPMTYCSELHRFSTPSMLD